MNLKNLNGLIDWLKENHGRQFEMAQWHRYQYQGDPDADKYAPQDHCGTSFCLAGYCEIQDQLNRGVARDKLEIGNWTFRYPQHGARHLGLSDEVAEHLFHMSDENVGPYGYNAEHRRAKFDRLCAPLRSEVAIRVLEILRDTGEAKWAKAFHEVTGTKL